MRRVSGPAGTDTLAAGGGTDLPGREAYPELAGGAPGAAAPHEIIPGERDATTLTHREPGAVGGQFAGADIPPGAPPDWMSAATRRDREHEGGGDR